LSLLLERLRVTSTRFLLRVLPLYAAEDLKKLLLKEVRHIIENKYSKYRANREQIQMCFPTMTV
jgi:hypothetical protein